MGLHMAWAPCPLGFSPDILTVADSKLTQTHTTATEQPSNHRATPWNASSPWFGLIYFVSVICLESHWPVITGYFGSFMGYVVV